MTNQTSRPIKLHLEHKTNTDAAHLGIGSSRPHISWQTETETANWTQSAYELELWSGQTRLETSGKINSSELRLIGAS